SRRDVLRSAGALASAAALDLAAGCAQPTARSQAPGPPAANPDLFDISDFERAAKKVMPSMAWEYISGGAADEITLRWNHEAYERLRLKPRALVDVSRLDTRVRLLGRELPFPILLAPTAYQQLTHP